MKVLLNAFARQWAEVQGRISDALDRVGASGWYILGKEVEAFERQLAAQWNLPFAIGCANGLDAIEIGLRALGIEPGQKVITTPLSAFATTLAIMRAGGIPVFVDVDEYGLIDLQKVEAALKNDGTIKFCVPVHLYGHCLDLSELQRLKETYDLKLVEDCAQSIYARSYDRMCGSVGEVATTSFYPTKNLGCIGDGGAILCSDPSLAGIMRSLRDYGQSAKYQHTLLGLNSRLDELQAAFLLELLPLLEKSTRRRAQIAQRYIQGLQNDLITIPGQPKGSDSVWHLFPILTSRRDLLQAHLKAAGVESAIHYPISIPAQESLSSVPFECHGKLVMTEKYCSQELSLPVHPYLTDEEVEYVIKTCNEWRP